MKRTFCKSFLIFVSSLAFAGGVSNKTNMSTGYLRNPSRNTEHQRPEAAFYNIAGTGFMNDGLYIEAGNQFVFKEYGNELKTGNYFASSGVYDYYSNDESTVWLYPDADIVFKRKKWSIFANFGIYAGGGSLSYSEGTSATSMMFLSGANTNKAEAEKYALAASMIQTATKSFDDAVNTKFSGNENAALSWIKANPNDQSAQALKQAYEVKNQYVANLQNYTTKKDAFGKAAKASLAMAQNHSIDVTSITYGGQIGASYMIFDWLSVAAAFRYVTGTQDMTLTCNDPTFIVLNGGNAITYTARGFGESCVIGAHLKAPFAPNLDFSVQYQTLSRIAYDVDSVDGNIASYYNITEDTTFRTDLPAVLNIGVGYRPFERLYLSSSFNYYFNKFADQNNILAETDYDDSWELSFGADFDVCKYIGISGGFQYGKQGINSNSNSTFEPVLDSICIGSGLEIHPSEKFTVTLAGIYCKYFNANYSLSGLKTELNKQTTLASIGLTYKPF